MGAGQTGSGGLAGDMGVHRPTDPSGDGHRSACLLPGPVGWILPKWADGRHLLDFLLQRSL